MKKEVCRKAVEAILASDGEFSPGLRTHLEQCDDCAAWAESWQLLCGRNIEKNEQPIPISAEFAILRKAQKTAKKINARKRWMLPKWFYAVSSAACAVMVAWLVAYSHYDQNVRPALKWDISKTENAIFELDSAIEYNRVFMNIGDGQKIQTKQDKPVETDTIKTEVIDSLRLVDLKTEIISEFTLPEIPVSLEGDINQ